MPDDTTTQPPDTSQTPDPSALIAQLQQQIQQAGQMQLPQPDQTPVPRSFTSLLGEAVGGGDMGLGGMSPAMREAAGNRSLLSFGMGLLASSGYHPVRTTMGEALAAGIQGAMGSEAQSQELGYQALGQKQQMAMKQQEFRLNALKEAVPLLNLQIEMAKMHALQNIGSSGPGQNTSIANVGIPRDPNAPTVGQQGNNPGNLMADNALPLGATGWIPAAGGRKVAAFPDLTTGIAANAANLTGYAGQGINTVHDAVKRWVGDPKADTGSYENDIAKALGVKPTDTIDLTNPAVQRAFILAQQPHETGKTWFTPGDVDKGVALAQTWRQGKGVPTTAPTATTTAPTPAGPGGLTAGATVGPGATMAGVPPPPGGPAGATTGPYTGGGVGSVLAGDVAPHVGGQQLTVAAPPSGKGSIVPAGKLQTTGKPPGVASIIQGGIQTAQATPVVPGTVLTAGPGAGTAPAAVAPPAAAAAAQPGWGTVVGSYGNAPAATVTPPAVPTPQVTGKGDQTPPSPSIVTTPTPPPAPESANTFTYDQNRFHPTPWLVEQASPNLLPNEQAARDQLERSYQVARQAANATFDPKQIQDVEQQFGQQRNALQQQITERLRQGQKDYAQAQKDDYDQQKDVWTTNHNAMITRANKADELQRSFDIDTAKTTTNLMANDANTARGTLRVLQQITPYLDNLPNGVLGGLVQKFPDLVPMLQYSHIVDPSQATAAQVVLAARNYLSLLQKPTGSGSLRVPEMDALASYTPGALNTPQARQEMMGHLLAVNQRVIDEYNYTLDHVGRADPKTGEKLYDIRGVDRSMNAPLKLDANGDPTPDSGLGDVIPRPPSLTAPDAQHNAYQQYVQKHVVPGMPYYTWQPRTDPTTHQLISGSDGKPIYDRVMKMKGYD